MKDLIKEIHENHFTNKVMCQGCDSLVEQPTIICSSCLERVKIARESSPLVSREKQLAVADLCGQFEMAINLVHREHHDARTNFRECSSISCRAAVVAINRVNK